MASEESEGGRGPNLGQGETRKSSADRTNEKEQGERQTSRARLGLLVDESENEVRSSRDAGVDDETRRWSKEDGEVHFEMLQRRK